MLIALTRDVSSSIGDCALTHMEREPIDVQLARTQHREYEEQLLALGCRVLRLPPLHALPDAVFVEDAAIVLDEVAIITRPGAESRRDEVSSVAQALLSYRRLYRIEAPGTIDGGDVLRVDRRLFVGVSARTNLSGLEQVRSMLSPLGYSVEAVPVHGCLHLKSAVTLVAENTLLINRDWVDDHRFADLDLIDVAPSEPFGANALLVNGVVLYSAAHPRTGQRLLDRGIAVQTLQVSELAKAEGGVTCCSLLVSTDSGT